jgi:hypothetical protein
MATNHAPARATLSGASRVVICEVFLDSKKAMRARKCRSSRRQLICCASGGIGAGRKDRKQMLGIFQLQEAGTIG